MILNSNPNLNSNLGIQTMEFQILHFLKRPEQGIQWIINQGIQKPMDFKSKSKCCHPNTTFKFLLLPSHKLVTNNVIAYDNAKHNHT